MGRHDDLVTSTDPSRAQYEGQCGGARSNANTVLDIAVPCEVLLELLNLDAERERARLEHPSKRSSQLVLERRVLATQCNECSSPLTFTLAAPVANPYRGTHFANSP
jgi:hypothetical protein